MPGAIHYQWQNPVLLKTVYPMRALKLRDFLLFDYEVQLWEKYYPIWQVFKDHLPDELRDQVKLVLEKEKEKLRQAVQEYEGDLKTLSSAVVLDPQHDYLKRIIPAVRTMHQMFAERFEGFSQTKQANYIRDRLAEFTALLQQVDRQLSNKQRAIRNNGNEWAERNGYPAIVQLLTDFTRPMVERELTLLRRYQAAYERMAEYEKQRLANEKRWREQQKAAEKDLKNLDKQVEAEQAKLNTVMEEIQRHHRMLQVQDHQDHFLTSNVKAVYRSEFDRIDEDMLDQIQRIHRQIRDHFKQPGTRADFLQGRVRFLQSILGLPPPNKNTAAARQEIGRKELDRLKDFQLAFARLENPQAVSAGIRQLETEQAALEQKLQDIRERQRGPKAILDEVIGSLNIPRSEQLLAMVDQKKVSILDIVKDMSDTCRFELQNKDEQELLEEAVQIFVNNPTKYPLWLQYMVVHFSGMRYKSAHGCWQHPKRLLIELRRQKFLQGDEAQGWKTSRMSRRWKSWQD
jgi:mRNA-degrading endonuclease YafQ of YafQ-DinJ toxin-antitoxin module